MNSITEDILMHYGMPRRSGRYPWGSGDSPYQHSNDFSSRLEELKKQGWKETPENIKKDFGMSVKAFRQEKTIAKDQRRMIDVARAKSLKSDGYGATEIGRIMGMNESTVRSLLDPNAEARMELTAKTASFLKDQVDKKGMVDVGTGVERELNVSKERLDTALYYLEKEGYHVYGGRVQQANNNPNQKTTQRILCTPDKEHKDIYDHENVHSLMDYVSHDGGETFDKFVYPKSMDSKRLKIRYAEEGGVDKDGIVEIRRGVDDLSLGEAHYSQVRILVDDKKYIKGMAVYSDDMPPGVDVVFNTNKSKDVAKLDVLKDIKSDPDNPFGSLIKAGGQSYYTDKNGKKQLSLINKRADEGDWNDWQDALPSQFLGKQSRKLAEKQLNLAKADKLAEFDEYCSLNNPTVKKHLLEKFADQCDSEAVHLKAAALPGQKYHVIIPVNTLKENEVYAPNYENGTKLALVRYPHGGTFEIPILTVNNKHAPARKLIGTDSIDAIGINKSNADRLSGADFDGDTVMCIPTHDKGGKIKITSTHPLKGLEGFDPKLAYKYSKEDIESGRAKLMKKTDTEMGVISNLITDMTLAGASDSEKAAAVRHSMVVIDAEKHKLNYKQSEIDNNIAALKKKYQVRIDEDGNERVGGASTILSRAKGEKRIDKTQGTPYVNIKGKSWYDPNRPEGSLIYKTADDLYYADSTYDKATKTKTIRTSNGKKVSYRMDDPEQREKYDPIKKVNEKTGEVIFTNKAGDITYVTKKRTVKSTNMAETDDANTLVSAAKHPMELLYADYANSMKALANRARKEAYTTKEIDYSASAKAAYQKEVDSLMSKLNTALKNSPRERAANRQAAAEVQAKQEADPSLTKGDIKKLNAQALSRARSNVSSVSRKDRNIVIEDREWEAIQAGAISKTKLRDILNNTDIDKLRERATPRTTNNLSQAKINTIKAMSSSNYTLEQIAKKLGVSTSTVSKYLKGAK